MKSLLVLLALVAVAAAQSGPRRPPGPGGPSRPDRPSRDSRDSRDSRPSRPHRDSRDSRDSRPSRPHRDSRDSRDSHEFRPPGGQNSFGNSGPLLRPNGSHDSRDSRNSQNSRDSRDSKDSRNSRDSRDSNEILPSNRQAAPAPFSFNGRNSLGCGFACSTSATFTTNIDGTQTTARCTDPNANVADRCAGCCGSVALAANVNTDRAAGFPSNNGRTCVCCIRSC